MVICILHFISDNVVDMYDLTLVIDIIFTVLIFKIATVEVLFDFLGKINPYRAKVITLCSTAGLES